MSWTSVLLALVCASCISGNYVRFDVEVPPDPVAIAKLVPGQSTLGECLDGLGAPLVVRELGTGAVLAWGARRDVGWNISANIPVGRVGNANFRYSQQRDSLKGVVLFFDADWTLVRFEEGWLGKILPNAKPRPQEIPVNDSDDQTSLEPGESPPRAGASIHRFP